MQYGGLTLATNVYAQRRSLYRWERGEVKIKHLIGKGQSLPPCGSMYMKQVAID